MNKELLAETLSTIVIIIISVLASIFIHWILGVVILIIFGIYEGIIWWKYSIIKNVEEETVSIPDKDEYVIH